VHVTGRIMVEHRREKIMRTRIAIVAAMTALGTALPAHANCIGISYLDGNWMVFVDLDNRSYTEYRVADRFTPPRDRNPAGRATQFQMLIEHDLKTDAVLGASIALNIDESNGQRIGVLDAASRIEASTDFATVSAPGTSLGLRRDRPELILTEPSDPVAGRAIYDAAAAGTPIRLHFTYNEDGNPPLDAVLTAAFPADPAYIAAAGKRARELNATWRRTRKCPVNPLFG
jgi:hypothetical protein